MENKPKNEEKIHNFPHKMSIKPKIKGGGGGGGGGGSGLSFWKNNFELRIGGEVGKARTRPDILMVVLGPYVQYCPGEASEQKLERKPQYGLMDIELSYCHHSICLQKTSILEKRPSKLDKK